MVLGTNETFHGSSVPHAMPMTLSFLPYGLTLCPNDAFHSHIVPHIVPNCLFSRCAERGTATRILLYCMADRLFDAHTQDVSSAKVRRKEMSDDSH